MGMRQGIHMDDMAETMKVVKEWIVIMKDQMCISTSQRK